MRNKVLFQLYFFSPRQSEMKDIASDPFSTHYFHIDKFTDLSKFVDQISTVSCDGEFCLLKSKKQLYYLYVDKNWRELYFVVFTQNSIYLG